MTNETGIKQLKIYFLKKPRNLNESVMTNRFHREFQPDLVRAFVLALFKIFMQGIRERLYYMNLPFTLFLWAAIRLKMFCPPLVALGEFLACAYLNNPSLSRLYFSMLLEQLLREKVTKTSCGIHSHMFMHTRFLPVDIL